MNVRCDVNIYANVQVLKLSVNKRTDASTPDTRRERTGGDRDPVADFQSCLFVVHRADLGSLQNFCISIRHEECKRSAWYSGNETAPVQRSELNEISRAPACDRRCVYQCHGRRRGNVRAQGVQTISADL